jgi:hypothetical protein
VIGGMPTVGAAGGLDGEADTCAVESAERVVWIDGDARGDAGGQPQYPVPLVAASRVQAPLPGSTLLLSSAPSTE